MKKLDQYQIKNVSGGLDNPDALILIGSAIIGGIATLCMRTPVHFNINSSSSAKLAGQYVAANRSSSDKIFNVWELG